MHMNKYIDCVHMTHYAHKKLAFSQPTRYVKYLLYIMQWFILWEKNAVMLDKIIYT